MEVPAWPAPIFTAIWAIADQYNGGPLGQAAPAVATLNSAQIADVVPPSSSLNSYDVTGWLEDRKGTTTFSAQKLFTRAST
jgi:hypothetical protein